MVRSILDFRSNLSNETFNGEEFKKYATPATMAKVRDASKVSKRLVRDKPIMRGFAVKWSAEPDKAQDFYWKVYDALVKHIDASSFSEEQKQSIKTFEKFQSTQKGPTGPLKDSIFLDVYNAFASKEPIVIDSAVADELGEIGDSLSKYLMKYCSIDVRNINFEETGNELPSSTVRGYPYHALGKQVDDEIKKQGGKTFQDALQYAALNTQSVAFLGGRIQGKPPEKGAKLRPVSIPSTFYQYLMVGLIAKQMEQLKNAPMFAGGNEPFTRHSMIMKILTSVRDDGGIFIALDYSRFDMLFAIIMREITLAIIVNFIRTDKEAHSVGDVMSKYRKNQFAFFPAFDGIPSDFQDTKLVELINNLMSGIKDTQESGSLGNAVFQGYVAKKLGYDIDGDRVLVLGDDAGFYVPGGLVAELGYEGVLVKIEEILKDVGAEMNAAKAYPTEELIFLQKLYNVQNDIKGLGTGARSLASFLYREKFPTKIPGIENISVMEVISQISIVNEAGAIEGIHCFDFASTFAQMGVDEDDVLCYLLQQFDKTGQTTGHELFKFLIKSARVDIEQILEYNEKLAYDHTFLNQQLQSSNYGEVFHILDYLIKTEHQRPVKESVVARVQDNDAEIVSAADVVDIMDD